MKHVVDESDQAAVPFGDQAVGLHPLIHESRKGPVSNFDRNMLAIKTQVARPQCIPLHTVTRSQRSDLGHGTCLLILQNDIRAWLSRSATQLSTTNGRLAISCRTSVRRDLQRIITVRKMFGEKSFAMFKDEVAERFGRRGARFRPG